MDSIISIDEPPRMGKRPTESGGEPSSSNCGYSAEGQAHQPHSNKKPDHFCVLGLFVYRLGWSFNANDGVRDQTRRGNQIQC